MNSIIQNLWNILNGYNLDSFSEILIGDDYFNYLFAPTIPYIPYTKPWITLNLNINKVVENIEIALNFSEDKKKYYILCENALILLVTSFEGYLVDIIQKIRDEKSLQKLDNKYILFQRKSKLKHYEIGIDIAHLDETL